MDKQQIPQEQKIQKKQYDNNEDDYHQRKMKKSSRSRSRNRKNRSRSQDKKDRKDKDKSRHHHHHHHSHNRPKSVEKKIQKDSKSKSKSRSKEIDQQQQPQQQQKLGVDSEKWDKAPDIQTTEENKEIPKKEEHPSIKQMYPGVHSANPLLIEVVVNDRLGHKERIKCRIDDTIGILKKLISAKTGTKAEKIRLQKQYVVYKDNITLDDYEIKDGMGIELYYN